jgi:hypothetical protein
MNQNDCAGRSDESLAKRKKEQGRIDDAISAALAAFEGDRERRLAFERLVATVRLRTALLKPTQGRASAGWVAPLFLINRLRNLAARQRHWIRPCEAWESASGNLRPAFRSLAQHLVAPYAVPGFMDSVWDLPAGAEGFRQQAWYIRLGRGTVFRHLNLPIGLTRRMEHHVRQAPDHYTVAQALRYGETRGLGGSEGLAREIVRGRLGQGIEHGVFWRGVIWFFVRQHELELRHVNPIVDFIQANKFAGEEVRTADGTEWRAPLWPHFSIEGRTIKSLLRLTEAWHADLSNKKDVLKLAWRPSGIQGYRFLERRGTEQPDLDWGIYELLGSAALYAEGRAMHHCVYDYSRMCQQGETTIWSLRLRVNDQEKSMATIQVNTRKRSIIQVRAKCNFPVVGRSHDIIRDWAAAQGLGYDVEA